MPQENEIRKKDIRKNKPDGVMSHTRILGIFALLIVFVAVFPKPETRFYKSGNIKSANTNNSQSIPFFTFRTAGKTIAFLPCCELPDLNSQNYLNAGLVEYFYNSFCKMPDLFDFEKKQISSAEASRSVLGKITDKLRVDYIIEFNMKMRKSNLRLSANIVDVLNESPVFYKIYDQETRNTEINEIIEDIAISITNDCKKVLDNKKNCQQLITQKEGFK